MKNHTWILGSKSPRRSELLAGIGCAFEVRTKDTPENYPKELALEKVPEYLATVKANALLEDLQENEVVICADTVVIINNEILGKPENEAEAKMMLQKLSANTHTVITGVFVGNKTKQIIFSDSTKVTFSKLTNSEIDFYIEQFKPFDKAGSYGIQEWIGFIGVKAIEGSYTNVMGLPTNKLYHVLVYF